MNTEPSRFEYSDIGIIDKIKIMFGYKIYIPCCLCKKQIYTHYVYNIRYYSCSYECGNIVMEKI